MLHLAACGLSLRHPAIIGKQVVVDVPAPPMFEASFDQIKQAHALQMVSS
jgi:hypothetical protein